MKNALVLSFLLLMLSAAPAPAQNLWPVSFGYWCNYPDRYMPDLRAADHSMAHADQMAGLDDHPLRTLMQSRNQAMSRYELESYHRPNMLPAIYPSDDEKAPASPASAPASSPDSGSAAAAPPPGHSPSPFPSTAPARDNSVPPQSLPKP
jgi:hypothetical protein